MAYNTQQEFLIMPEYGRNVQQLVRHAQKLEESAYRQQFCEQIVDLIQQLYPQSKSIEDYREKLWKHLFQIAKYDLDTFTLWVKLLNQIHDLFTKLLSISRLFQFLSVPHELLHITTVFGHDEKLLLRVISQVWQCFFVFFHYS